MLLFILQKGRLQQKVITPSEQYRPEFQQKPSRHAKRNNYHRRGIDVAARFTVSRGLVRCAACRLKELSRRPSDVDD